MLWASLFVAAIAVFSASQSWRGFRYGAVLSGYGDVRRETEPVWFWFLLIFYTASAAFLGVLAPLFVLLLSI